MISLQNHPSGTSPQPQALRLPTEREIPRLHEGLPKLSDFGALLRLHMGVRQRKRSTFDGAVYFIHRFSRSQVPGVQDHNALTIYLM